MFIFIYIYIIRYTILKAKEKESQQEVHLIHSIMSRKLTGNISLKYNIPLPIAKEVAGHIIHIIITD